MKQKENKFVKWLLDANRTAALIVTYILLFLFVCTVAFAINLVLVGSFWAATLVFFPDNPILLQHVLGVIGALTFILGVLLFFREEHPDVNQ